MKRTREGFLEACKAVDSRNQALEEIRDSGANVILALFRMFKNCLVHSLDNQAVEQTIADTHRIITDFGAIVGGLVSITFVDDTVFVCGQLLRASRGTYDSATEVGKMLAHVGVSEINFTGDVSPDDLATLCGHFANSVRDPARRDELAKAKLTNIQVRLVDSTLERKQDESQMPDMARALHAYASALVVMREFFDRIAQGKAVLPHRVKRVAQRLVRLTQESEQAVLTLTTLANAHRDEAGRAIQAALLSIVIARRLTSSRNALAQLGMASLMADVGRVRVAGATSEENYVGLSDDVERAVPALTSALCISTGGVTMHNAVRTVTAFEATSIERAELVGPLYRRAMAPMVQAKILHAVRVLLDKLAPRDAARARAMSPLDALASMAGARDIDQTVYKLMIDALGVMPTGTVVEFETGEWGVVVGPSSNRGAVARPRVKVVTDRAGQVFSHPKVIDLGDQAKGRRFPRITGIIEPSKARFNLTGVLMKDSGTAAPS